MCVGCCCVVGFLYSVSMFLCSGSSIVILCMQHIPDQTQKNHHIVLSFCSNFEALCVWMCVCLCVCYYHTHIKNFCWSWGWCCSENVLVSLYTSVNITFRSAISLFGKWKEKNGYKYTKHRKVPQSKKKEEKKKCWSLGFIPFTWNVHQKNGNKKCYRIKDYYWWWVDE